MKYAILLLILGLMVFGCTGNTQEEYTYTVAHYRGGNCVIFLEKSQPYQTVEELPKVVYVSENLPQEFVGMQHPVIIYQNEETNEEIRLYSIEKKLVIGTYNDVGGGGAVYDKAYLDFFDIEDLPESEFKTVCNENVW